MTPALRPQVRPECGSLRVRARERRLNSVRTCGDTRRADSTTRPDGPTLDAVSPGGVMGGRHDLRSARTSVMRARRTPGVRAVPVLPVPTGIRRAVTGAEEIRPHLIPVEGICPEAISPLFGPGPVHPERCCTRVRHRFVIHAHPRSPGGAS